MKNLFILLITIMFISCSNDTANSQAEIMGAGVNIYLKSSTGGDILGTAKYPTAGIYANYLINGKIVQNVSDAGVILDYPNNVHIVNENNSHYVNVFLNTSATEEFPITYIHWNSTETDTLKAQYRRGDGLAGKYIVCEKIWLNDVLVWEVTVQGQINNDITIVK